MRTSIKMTVGTSIAKRGASTPSFLVGYEPSLHVKKSFNLDWCLLLNSKDPVTSSVSLTFKFDYPLDDSYEFTFKKRKGWTVGDVVSKIQHVYEKVIYLNKESVRKFGVWGHDIGDLMIESIHLVKKTNGKEYITMSIGS